MKISVLLPTVLPSYPICVDPKTHILDYVADCLEQQDFPHDEFELVIIDALWEERFGHHFPTSERGDVPAPAPWSGKEYSFPIVHLPPLEGWVLENRKTNHALMRNSGLCAVRGELVFLCDDTVTVGPDFLSRIWHEYEHGWMVSPLVDWRRGDKLIRNSVDWRIGWLEERELSRYAMYDDPLDSKRLNTALGFGPVSFPLELALALNGYDELYDAGTQYLDTTFAIRLAKHAPQFTDGKVKGLVIDKEIWCRHEQHGLPDNRILDCWHENGTASTFYQALKCNRTLHFTQRQVGYPVRANVPENLDAMLFKWFAHCPYYVEKKPNVIEADGLPPIQGCSIDERLGCKVSWLARQGETPELQAWARQYVEERCFDLRELRARFQAEFFTE